MLAKTSLPRTVILPGTAGHERLPHVRARPAHRASPPTLAAERLESEQRRYEVGLSTTFLVTQAQRDLLEAQVNLLQTTLDYQSSLVNFDAVQQAPPLAATTAGSPIGIRGANVVALPTSAPQGIFRPGAGLGF